MSEEKKSQKTVERYPLDQMRYSKEERPQKKTFVNLDGNAFGIEIDWVAQTAMFFIYKEKRRNDIARSEVFSWWDDFNVMKKAMMKMVSDYYRKQGRDPKLALYTKIELTLPVTAFHYHVNAGTIGTVCEKEVIYF